MLAAAEMAARLECGGGVFITGYSASDARVAFAGGVKKSGRSRAFTHFWFTRIL